MTTETLHTKPDNNTPPEPSIGRPPGRTARGIGFRAGLVALFAVIVGVITYAVSNATPASYTSSTEVRLTVNESNGLGQDSLQAANELTAQVVQLIPTDSILAGQAAKLGTSTSALRSSISVGSVAQENLLQISATGSSPSEAQARATSVTQGFIAFMARDAKSQLNSYQRGLQGGIGTMTSGIGKLANQLRNATGTKATVLQAELGSLAAEQQSLRTQLAQRQASSVPAVQLVQSAGAGGKTSPRPVLYTIVAILVAIFVGTQLVALTERKRRAAL